VILFNIFTIFTILYSIILLFSPHLLDIFTISFSKFTIFTILYSTFSPISTQQSHHFNHIYLTFLPLYSTFSPISLNNITTFATFTRLFHHFNSTFSPHFLNIFTIFISVQKYFEYSHPFSQKILKVCLILPNKASNMSQTSTSFTISHSVH